MSEINYEEIVAKYIKRAEDFIKRYGRIFKMMTDSTITSFEVNASLVEWNQIVPEITTESIRKSNELIKINIAYQDWYDHKFIESKQKVMSEQIGKSTKPSQKEIETQLRIDNKEDYKKWQYKIMLAQSDYDLIDRIRKDFYQVASNLQNINYSLNAERKSI
jgi:uncharacterized protein YqgV (UPF0045/DUF77 family)